MIRIRRHQQQGTRRRLNIGVHHYNVAVVGCHNSNNSSSNNIIIIIITRLGLLLAAVLCSSSCGNINSKRTSCSRVVAFLHPTSTTSSNHHRKRDLVSSSSLVLLPTIQQSRHNVNDDVVIVITKMTRDNHREVFYNNNDDDSIVEEKDDNTGLNHQKEQQHHNHINTSPDDEDSNKSNNNNNNQNGCPTTGLSSPPLFTVGVIADIQYAPIPDGTSYTGTPRFYRHSLEVAKHAFQHFERDKVRLVVNLGDTIDGKCQDIVALNGNNDGHDDNDQNNSKNDDDDNHVETTTTTTVLLPPNIDPGHFSLDHVLDAISSYQSGPILHTYGNHCLYNLDRSTLQDRLGIVFTKEPCGDLVGYYDHVMDDDKVRFVVIDGYDIAMMQRCEVSSRKRRQAVEILRANNPNFDHNMNSPVGLEGVNKRFVAFNGSVGPLQLDWIRRTLTDARRLNQRVIILSHQPILPESSSPVCLIWNYDEVLALLRDFSDVVVASFCGHAHKGGYCRDVESGIHFRVFEAALENKPERTYAMVDVHEDSLVVRGFGNCQSAVYEFDHCQKKRDCLTSMN